MILRDEMFSVFVQYGQYFLADPDSYPGMGGPAPEEFPDFSIPGPLGVQSAEGIVLLVSKLHTGFLPVRYVLSDSQPERDSGYPDLIGEVQAEFPTGLAELRGLMSDAASDASLLQGHPGSYGVRLNARGDADNESHLLCLWKL